MTKWKNTAGHTLLETLLSLLILMLGLGLLAGGIATASGLQGLLRGEDNDFTYTADSYQENAVIFVDGQPIAVELYESNGYYYYVYEADEE